MDANTTNPYESPSTESHHPRTKKTQPHGTSIRKEAWRGAKFGAKITAIGLGALTGVIWLFVSALSVFRWWSTDVSPLVQCGGVLELLKQIGGSIVGIALAAFYAAIIGAIVMAIAAALRKFRATASD